MPGNSNSGRKPEPTRLKILKGTVKPSDLRPEPVPEGKPVEPRWGPLEESRYARGLWRRVVPELVKLGIATNLDQEALEAMCDWYQLYKTADSHNSRHRAWSEVRQLMSSFGMMPTDRVKLRGLTTIAREKEKQGISKYLA